MCFLHFLGVGLCLYCTGVSVMSSEMVKAVKMTWGVITLGGTETVLRLLHDVLMFSRLAVQLNFATLTMAKCYSSRGRKQIGHPNTFEVLYFWVAALCNTCISQQLKRNVSLEAACSSPPPRSPPTPYRTPPEVYPPTGKCSYQTVCRNIHRTYPSSVWKLSVWLHDHSVADGMTFFRLCS